MESFLHCVILYAVETRTKSKGIRKKIKIFGAEEEKYWKFPGQIKLRLKMYAIEWTKPNQYGK